MRGVKLNIRVLGCLLLIVSTARAQEVADHEGESTSPTSSVNKRAIGEAPANEEMRHYVRCDPNGEVINSAWDPVPPKELSRGMVVHSANGEWRLATPNETNLAECETLVSDETGNVLGIYDPTAKKVLGCDLDPFPSSIPGEFINRKRSVRYFPIRSPDSNGHSAPIEYVPTPCSLQDLDTLVSVLGPKGALKSVAFSLVHFDWIHQSDDHLQSTIISLLQKQIERGGHYASAAKECFDILSAKTNRGGQAHTKRLTTGKAKQ